MIYQHIPTRLPCPYLPSVTAVIRPSSLRKLKRGGDRRLYFESTQQCAQSLWLCGLPAQALLQLNFSLSLTLADEVDQPYPAIQWIMRQYAQEGFIANPVRHYQHLATRMSGEGVELRVLRAWLCFYLAEATLPRDKFPRDLDQISAEELTIPPFNTLLLELEGRDRWREAKGVRELLMQALLESP